MLQYRLHEAVQAFVFFWWSGQQGRFRLNERTQIHFGGGVLNQGTDGLWSGFQVELKADGSAHLEGLIGASLATSEMDGSLRKVKCVSMPLEDFGGGRKTEGRGDVMG